MRLFVSGEMEVVRSVYSCLFLVGQGRTATADLLRLGNLAEEASVLMMLLIIVLHPLGGGFIFGFVGAGALLLA